MKIRRGLSLLSTVLGLALAGAVGAGEVTFRFNDAEHKEIRDALDVFQSQNPGIKVVLQRIAWSDAREQFLREAAVGQGPDIGHFGQVMTRSMGQAGAFLKLNELVRKYGLEEQWKTDFLS